MSVSNAPPAQTLRDRVWLWGMKVNALQETEFFGRMGMPRSTLTVQEAIRQTGLTNVLIAGGLPLTRATLDGMPAARRVICKTSLHHPVSESEHVLEVEACAARLLEAKALAAADPRVEGFLLDDFSTGSIHAGARPEHLAPLAFLDTVAGPSLPLMATIYTMSLDRPELPPLLPFFARYVVPIWHADQLDTAPAALDRLAELSGGKPALFCIYLFDFGNSRQIEPALMRRQLELAEEMMHAQRIAGMVICGTCMMDLPWDSNRVLYDWLDRAGSTPVAGAAAPATTA